jgi:protein required for attachment to host cells
MNSVQHTPQVQHISLDESVARKFLRAYDLLHECSAREQQNIEFATQIAHRLESGRKEDTFDELVLIAPPAFLGLLRRRLSKTLMERVSLEIDKNLVKQSAATVAAHVWSAT